jgi:hypothetical protein
MGNWITLLLVVLISEILVVTSATNIRLPFLMMRVSDDVPQISGVLLRNPVEIPDSGRKPILPTKAGAFCR